jgi:hypothetical protein
MLWYKNWLESRWRLSVPAVFYALLLYAAYSDGGPVNDGRMGPIFSFVWIFAAVFVAGTGIKTQSASLRSMKGLHGSTYFTLSLPVSRSALFGARTMLGLIQMGGIIVLGCCGLWALFPALRAESTFAGAVVYGLTIFACSLGFYFVSALLAVFLDPQWQVYAAIILIGVCQWLTGGVQSGFNVFRVLADGGQFASHTIPWAAMGTSFAIATILCLLTLRIIRTREF